MIYDRALPESEDGASASYDELPREIGTLTVFGKETDRPARLRAMLVKTDEFESHVKSLGQTCDADFSLENGEAVIPVHRLHHALRPNFLIPQLTDVNQLRSLQQTWFEEAVYTVWPKTPMSFLNGLCPEEAAKERKLKRKVLAAILNLENSFEQQPIEIDFNRLRAQLELPVSEPLDPNSLAANMVTSAAMRRLDLEKATDEFLADIFGSASLRPSGRTLYRIGKEILRRADTMKDHVDLIEVHARMAETTSLTDESLEHLAAARDLAVAKGESPATWLLSELDLRIQRKELDIAQRLITEIQARYLQEPGIAQMFAQLLAKYGLLPGEGNRTTTKREMAQAEIPAEMAAVASSAPGSPNTLWTPDASSTPKSAGDPSTAEPTESKIWMPGMD